MNEKLEVIRRCLTLVCRIAARGACSPDPCYVEDALLQLRFALLDPRHRRDTHIQIVETRRCELIEIYQDLAFIDTNAHKFIASDVVRFAVQSTTN
jgi:hypothetical protein